MIPRRAFLHQLTRVRVSLSPGDGLQTKVGPTLVKLEGDWVSAVRKNIEIESQCTRLERECHLLREALK